MRESSQTINSITATLQPNSNNVSFIDRERDRSLNYDYHAS